MADILYDFSGRDYTAAYERLLAILQSEVPELTDLNHSDAGISLIRLLARESDQLAFYLDEAFAEGFVNTARYKQSLCDLAKLVDYPPKLAAAASCTLTLTRKDGVVGDVSIPQWSSFTRSDGRAYVCTSAATLAAANDTIDITVYEGAHEQIVVGTGDWIQPDLSGLWKYNLGANVAYGLVTLSHDAGASVWTEVESFWRSFSNDLDFLLEFYADLYESVADTVFLVLGPYGKPATNATVDLVRCNGRSGNTGIGTITTVADAPLSSSVTCSNAEAATGGDAAEAIEDLRERIPRVTRTQRRAVTAEDYEAVVESISGVSDCQAVDRRWGDEWPHEYVVLFVVPSGGGSMSSPLKSSIWAELADKGHRGDWQERYLLRDADELELDISATVGISAGFVAVTVLGNVETALETFLSEEGVDIYEPVTISDLYNVVMGVSGVSYVNFTAPTTTTTPDVGEIVVAGTITLTEGE